MELSCWNLDTCINKRQTAQSLKNGISKKLEGRETEVTLFSIGPTDFFLLSFTNYWSSEFSSPMSRAT